MDTPLCGCGCGQHIPWTPNLRYEKRKGFLHGHHNRPAPPEQPKPCACGCGAPTTVRKGKASLFRSGHNKPRAAGTTHTEEVKSVIRAKRATQQNVAGIAPHGLSRTPTYKSWISMIWRCRDPRDASYRLYGGRGITVCERWDRHAGGNFLNFLADMGERPAGMTLDRIDGNGNYTPENCRWATLAQQNANRPADNGWKARRAKTAVHS